MTAEIVGMDVVPTAVYRFFNSAEVLLYVGVTESPAKRWRDHAKLKPWWAEVAKRTLAWHPNRDSAEAEELIAIQTESPIYNVAGKPRPKTPPKQRDWRSWEESRKDPQRALRVAEAEWKDYEFICDREHTNRNADINAFIRRRIKAFRRKNPDVPMPSDQKLDAPDS